jgi:hypothetical protein
MEVFLSLEGEPHLELSPIETGQHLAGSGRGRVGRRWEAQRARAGAGQVASAHSALGSAAPKSEATLDKNLS